MKHTKTGIKEERSDKEQDINIAFDRQIADLQVCKSNALVNAQIEALQMYKRLINGLPDGYPIPLADRK